MTQNDINALLIETIFHGRLFFFYQHLDPSYFFFFFFSHSVQMQIYIVYCLEQEELKTRRK